MNVHIIGMGALGLMYGSHIKKYGDEGKIAFVMDSGRIKKYSGQVFSCNGQDETFRMLDCEKTEPADLVIVAVKYLGLLQAVKTMRNSVGTDTIIMSVMNGISSEDIIAGTYGKEHMIYTVAQGMDAMKFGNELKYTQMGELCIGAKEEVQRENVLRVAKYFSEIQMPYIVDEDIMHRIWGKFMLNVGVNQTCMAYDTDYEGVLKPGEPNKVMLGAMREVICLADAEGISLSEEDLDFYLGLLGKLDPKGLPSMAQDRVSGRPSEVEMFAGTVIEHSRRKGLEVPVNKMLYNKVKEIEKQYR